MLVYFKLLALYIISIYVGLLCCQLLVIYIYMWAIYIYVGYKLLAIYINLHAWLAILEASQKIKIIQKYKYNLSTRILKKNSV